AQVPLIKEILTAFGIPIYEKPGFEADDLIGTLAEKSKKNPPVGGLQTIIMTGDLDTLQLVEDKKVVVLTLRKGVTDTVIYDENGVVKRYGLKPEKLNDFKGLKGDPSDNIPGVAGVGEKTASELIKEFGDLENLYKFLENQKDKEKFKKPLTAKLAEKLLENKDMAFFSKKLSTIIREIDLDFDLDKADWLKNMRREEIARLFKEMGLYSLIKRLDEINAPSQREMVLPETAASDKAGVQVEEIRTEKEIKEITDRINNEKEMVFDINGGFINIALGNECKNIAWPFIVGTKEFFKTFKELFENKNIFKTAHDFKEIAKFLLEYGIELNGPGFDTKLAAYLFNSDRKDYSLDKMYFNEFN
ncbi:MAG: 5'-3' exonuclease H3TH domain-containing protein, partial [Patescibacteria group bacterium]